MQNDGNNNFNNQNGQPGPGGYEYNPNDFQGGQNNYQNYNNGQGGYDPNGFNNGGFGQPPQNRIRKYAVIPNVSGPVTSNE